MSTLLITLPALLAQAANDTGSAGGAAVGLGIFVMLLWAIGLLALLFTIWMLIDCLMSALPATEKLIWVLVILFLSGLGALLYFFLARGKRATPIN